MNQSILINAFALNPDVANNKLIMTLKDGVDNLSVVADFDMTMTKEYSDETPGIYSFDVISNFISCPIFTKGLEERFAKYYPYESDSRYSLEERAWALASWAKEDIQAIKDLGENVEWGRAVKHAHNSKKLVFRDGVTEFMEDCRKLGVPFTIISAGLNNVIRELLKIYNIQFTDDPQLNCIANEVICSNDSDCEAQIVHPLNKHIAYSNHLSKRNVLNKRTNHIVIGDSLNDANVASELKGHNTLKIGFLKQNASEELKDKFCNAYDFVIMKNGDFSFIRSIFHLIANAPSKENIEHVALCK